MPTNLYGPNDNFHLENSHVLPAMIRKIYLAKCLNEGNWDAVRKDINLRPVEGVDGKNTDQEIIAELAKFGIAADAVTLWGTGKPLREFLWSEEMAEKIMKEIDFKGELRWDSTKPDGTPRKLIDVTKLHNLGWHHKVEIDEGIHRLYESYKLGICINHQTK